jgi:diketogulonate reductase-like aldo/keto reductase
MKYVDVGGIRVPSFIYGTAWKEERTEDAVALALAEGFRGIDTANQRRHYNEPGVGQAIAKSGLSRDDLLLQTKYTYVESQDHRLPYDPSADYPTQVRQSFASSLEHLGVDRLDSYVLHGPRTRAGFSEIDRQVWQTMEELHREKRTTLLGVSNVTAEQLATLCRTAKVKPAFVQNRCYARMGWDRAVREVCRAEGVVYQGFSLLTANAAELHSPRMQRIAERHRVTATRVVFAFALEVGMICLTGTTDPDHMRDDLAAFDLELSSDDVAAIERISG